MGSCYLLPFLSVPNHTERWELSKLQCQYNPIGLEQLALDVCTLGRLIDLSLHNCLATNRIIMLAVWHFVFYLNVLSYMGRPCGLGISVIFNCFRGTKWRLYLITNRKHWLTWPSKYCRHMWCVEEFGFDHFTVFDLCFQILSRPCLYM